MRKFFFFGLCAVIFITSSCLKGGNSSATNCNYDACQVKAPDSQIVKLKAYLDSIGVTAQKHCSGMYYTIGNPGTGDSPTGCSDVAINYTGTFTDRVTVFDKSSAPVVFSLLNLITGWKNGLPLLKRGGKITLYVPPALAYGQNQYQTIPGNSILIFDIDLLDFQ